MLLPLSFFWPIGQVEHIMLAFHLDKALEGSPYSTPVIHYHLVQVNHLCKTCIMSLISKPWTFSILQSQLWTITETLVLYRKSLDAKPLNS